MRCNSIHSTLALAVLALAACGGADESMDEAPSGDMATVSSTTLDCYIARGTAAEAQERPSPLRETRFQVGGHDALLCYGAPSARGRDIMGGLLVYGQPERIGANEATALHLTGPANVGGVALQPGSYSIYAIADSTEWRFFVNSNWQRWGIPIDDAVRSTEVGTFTATPEPTSEFVETLRYRFEPMEGGMGDLMLEWENTRVRMHVHPGM